MSQIGDKRTMCHRQNQDLQNGDWKDANGQNNLIPGEKATPIPGELGNRAKHLFSLLKGFLDEP